MHKYIPVAEIEIDEQSAAIINIAKVFAPEHFPLGVFCNNGETDRLALNEWWSRRSIPASRIGLREALETLNIGYAQLLLTKCYGLGLSDQYWIRPNNSDLTWDAINFFTNPFSDDVSNVLFGINPINKKINLMSPDNTSDGWLRKKWKIADDKRILVKSGSNPFQQEPLNEKMATEICSRIGINHVTYDVFWEDELPYSVCENFIDLHTELVSAQQIMLTKDRDKETTAYQHFIDCCDNLGIRGTREFLDRMLTLDFLIVNEDRHYGNFGAVRNAQTLEWLGFAPIFDSGTSLWHDHLIFKHSGKHTPSKPFRDSHTEQIELVTTFDWLDLSVLDGIEDEFEQILLSNPRINRERRDFLCLALKHRVELLKIMSAK
jgi:hypothetical protein